MNTKNIICKGDCFGTCYCYTITSTNYNIHTFFILADFLFKFHVTLAVLSFLCLNFFLYLAVVSSHLQELKLLYADEAVAVVAEVVSAEVVAVVVSVEVVAVVVSAEVVAVAVSAEVVAVVFSALAVVAAVLSPFSVVACYYCLLD